MKGERSFFFLLFFFSVVSLGYCCAQAFPFDARSLLHKMLQARPAEGQGDAGGTATPARRGYLGHHLPARLCLEHL